jgi:hypothetical protein
VSITRLLRKAGLNWTRSGEGDHANGVSDPRVGLRLLRLMYETAFAAPAAFVGVGQTRNHLALLQEADWPMVLSHDDARITRQLTTRVPSARLVSGGPQGWSDGVRRIIDMLQLRRWRPCPSRGIALG